MTSPFKIFIFAAEPSGDLLARSCVRDLRQLVPHAEFKGVGEAWLQEVGEQSLVPMQDLTAFGIFEILPRLYKIRQRLLQITSFIKEWQPDILLTVDAPDASFYLHKHLQNTKIHHVHYVAPTVWAWRPGRAKKIAPLLDHLLCLFPFEPAYFEPHGLKATFVGHPLAQEHLDRVDPTAFQKEFNLNSKAPTVCLLPGSRTGEVARLTPIFLETFKKLRQELPTLQGVLPVAEAMKSYFETASLPQGVKLCPQDRRFEAMRSSQVALAASGTITLELACAQRPMAVGYKVSALTAWLAYTFKLVKTPYMSLPNILYHHCVSKKKAPIPERVQAECTSEHLLKDLKDVLHHSEEQRAFFHTLPAILNAPQTAAQAILEKYQ